MRAWVCVVLKHVCTCAYTRLFKVNAENLPQEPRPSSLRQDLSNPQLTSSLAGQLALEPHLYLLEPELQMGHHTLLTFCGGLGIWILVLTFLSLWPKFEVFMFVCLWFSQFWGKENELVAKISWKATKIRVPVKIWKGAGTFAQILGLLPLHLHWTSQKHLKAHRFQPKFNTFLPNPPFFRFYPCNRSCLWNPCQVF